MQGMQSPRERGRFISDNIVRSIFAIIASAQWTMQNLMHARLALEHMLRLANAA